MELKDYQNGVLDKLDYYLKKLADTKEEAEDFVAFQKMKGKEARLTDYAKDTWEALVQERRIDLLKDKSGHLVPAPYVTRFDGLERPIPNVCLKVPTGGGKTLLGVAAVERLQTDLFTQQTGMVLWVVPSDAIYKQTWKQLANREHPYRQMLERASGGRVKMLEKNDAFTKRDTDENLCVMLLMLQSSARQSKETLRMFRDSGRFTTFFPIEDDTIANEALLSSIRNLDCNDLSDYGWQEGIAPGSVSVKQSLGNVLRMVRPVIIVDEGHKAYSETARETLCGFNPKFILELSATPNANGKHHSNVLVNVSGQALKDEQMIKLPINLINEDKSEWKHTLSLAHAKLAELEQDAGQLQNETGRYIRPIMLIRVERTGKDQRDSAFVHAEDAREYLMEKLGVNENEIRLKTSDKDELGDDDLLSEMCPVKYIITKDALREGWDCPFAYVLTVLSKMTAKTAITQMIGRVLRQPHARLTQKPSLDECYVYTFDQDVMEAVAGVKQGLEEEGMGDVANQVKATEANKPAAVVSKETLLRRERFRNLPKIFLPRVLHRDSGYKVGYRLFDYERDVLGDLDWESLSYLNAENFQLVDDKLKRTIARIDYKMSKDNQGELDLVDPVHENIEFDPSAGLDISFMVRQLTDVIPNPWQAMRVLTHTLDTLRSNGVTEEALFTNRLELLKEMKRDIKQQVAQLSEQIFRSKLDKGDISLRLLASDNEKLNWELAQTLEVNVSEHDQVLRRKDGSELEKSLFEKVYQNGLNNLERDTAWYLDKQESVYWWHRIAVNQREYSLQGWQKQKVYPDLLVCVEQPDSGSYRFSVLETKGEHLKGNDDTVYKRRLFELLTEHVKTAVDAGELTLEAASGGMSFRMLMEDSWSQEIVPELN
ncbi:DEAD/DEAH box helicase [Salmonella enterica]|uniref:Restriction endonuclease subunit R n=3 Tax=Gammaproteobacteria TaxID=1236 RepID=A0A722XKW8_SALER|nr:DEAD/DEAH box helicase family protein [Salmonella enterica]RFT59353.1 restriction endonuclease subunit R [Salmonella enterica subsp. enterica serovar Senftenberg]QNN38200.1 DEAD/DEAH box helicase family protein [Salmonella enterica subsp. enterica serovar Albany]QOE48058.1 DEAD/DEAH box helicase family protein [Salmonella enterica subsp. enterica serovar Albany]QOE93604.1 DEAD/DEAH box helicase family protein [Salmonella enterica subsp. enterica serovar Albany]HAD8714408.1 restriction endon